MMNAPDITAAITPIIDAFEQLGIPYYIGGSVASTVYGIPRTTLDADIIAELRPEHAHPLVLQLQDKYYIDEDAVKDAIRHHFSFNAIHFATMLKIDVYLPKERPFDQEIRHRARQKLLDEHTFYFASPEDTILTKLEWYRMGGEVSERQWNDLLGVLKLQGTNLDFTYLQRWAVSLNVADLLKRAYEDAGLDI
ncbi:MAG TPA: hypothetical protein VNG51_13405 [Ktedonobacteraceae bacterium]|nr:hypothetical protein [Ktedonobacteraceae bacterium]